METPYGQPERPPTLDVGDVLGTTGRAIASNVATVAVIAAICMIPSLVLDLVNAFVIMPAVTPSPAELTRSPLAMFSSGMFGALLASVAVGVLMGYVAQGALVYATVEFLAGRHASVGAALTKSVSRLLFVFIAGIIVAFCTCGGALLCLVPGIIIACVLYVAIPVIVVERAGPFEALNRSAELTKGYRMSIFLVALVVGVAAIVLMCGVGMATAPLKMASPAAGLSAAPGPLDVVAILIQWVVSIVTTVLFAVLPAVIYAKLRGIRDGIDASQLANVFS